MAEVAAEVQEAEGGRKEELRRQHRVLAITLEADAAETERVSLTIWSMAAGMACMVYGVLYGVWYTVWSMVYGTEYGIQYGVWYTVRSMVYSMEYGIRYGDKAGVLGFFQTHARVGCTHACVYCTSLGYPTAA
eukprot:2975415-Pyramimonas_sp.AAC.1